MSSPRGTKVVIVGAGIAGFSCALELKGLKARCTILEKESTVGGRTRSYTESGYVFDQGLHFFVGGFKSLIPILERSGVRMTTVGEGAVWIKDGEKHIVRKSAVDLARFGLLPVPDRARLGLLVQENIGREDNEFLDIDNMTFTQYAEEKGIPESIQNDFYDPLIRTVTFMTPDEVSAGQYLYSEKLRFAYEEGFRAMYPERGGLGSVPYTLMLQARNFAVEPRVNCAVKQVVIEDDKVQGVEYETEGKAEYLEADAAVITTPIDLLPNLVKMNKLPSDFAKAVGKFSYTPSTVAYFGLSSRVLDFNVGAFVPGRKINIIAEAKRVSGVLAPIGESLLTVTSIDKDLLKMSNGEATEAILDELKELIPGVEKKVTWKKSWKIWRSVLAQPPGIFEDRLKTNRTGVEGLYVAGSHANCGMYYASMEAASRSGIACAGEMVADLT
ncbi:MAG: FAD-dependent oxidoreductase [Candidatus Thorarchaeota archaeon]|nr:MAG: FAD-dependent oxidoreductase [Candidatus Thorarchaeota archaeon]